MIKIITMIFTTLGLVIGVILSLALIMGGAWGLSPFIPIVATVVITFGLAVIFGALGYTIARFACTESSCISPDIPEPPCINQTDEDDEEYTCFSINFFKDPQQENLKYALRSYTKTCEAQEIELQEINSILNLINVEWAILSKRKTLEIGKLINENPILTRNHALNTQTTIEDDKAESISKIKELTNSYPKLGSGNKTANEVLDTERQRILHHEELKNLMSDFITENAEFINLNTSEVYHQLSM
ncbi:MAG: hypothetical protein H0T84_01450 [Tatlockia sp.]|nr:hypothetical protein [Tatlockia sp.]